MKIATYPRQIRSLLQFIYIHAEVIEVIEFRIWLTYLKNVYFISE